MLTEAYNQNVSVQRGKSLASLAKYFTLKTIAISNVDLLSGIPGGKWLHVAINTLLHKVWSDLPSF